MLVAEVGRFGGPEVLTARQVPDPVAGPGQVVVRTSAADVLFLDALIRSGRGVDFFPLRPPYVPGNGVAGQVISGGDGAGCRLGWPCRGGPHRRAGRFRRLRRAGRGGRR